MWLIKSFTSLNFFFHPTMLYLNGVVENEKLQRIALINIHMIYVCVCVCTVCVTQRQKYIAKNNTQCFVRRRIRKCGRFELWIHCFTLFCFCRFNFSTLYTSAQLLHNTKMIFKSLSSVEAFHFISCLWREILCGYTQV